MTEEPEREILFVPWMLVAFFVGALIVGIIGVVALFTGGLFQ